MSTWKKIISGVLAVLMMCCCVTAPVMADSCVETAILGENNQYCDDGSGLT